jgi:hypothetical protein
MACTNCGDIDLTPCPPSIPVEPISYKKCNPCKKIACKQKIDTACVYYKLNQNNCGESLKYLTIQNNTSVENIIEKVDVELDKITKPTLINCFVTKSGVDLTTYRLNDVLLKLQEGYCQQIDMSVSSLETMLRTIRDTPSLKELFCEIVGAC